VPGESGQRRRGSALSSRDNATATATATATSFLPQHPIFANNAPTMAMEDVLPAILVIGVVWVVIRWLTGSSKCHPDEPGSRPAGLWAFAAQPLGSSKSNGARLMRVQVIDVFADQITETPRAPGDGIPGVTPSMVRPPRRMLATALIQLFHLPLLSEVTADMSLGRHGPFGVPGCASVERYLPLVQNPFDTSDERGDSRAGFSPCGTSAMSTSKPHAQTHSNFLSHP
jgi:hypothetical protein